MVIRDYIDSDYSQIVALLKSIFDSNIEKDSLEQNYLGNNKRILVAVDTNSENLVGFALIEDKTDYLRMKRVLFISFLGVDENYRKRGIGKLLVNAVEKICKEEKYDAIELTSANYRTDTHVFYKNLGFTVKKTTVFIKEIQ